MCFNDFIIILAKLIKNSEIFGRLLSDLRIPIPLLYEFDNNEKISFNPNLLKGILTINNHNLILNIGSPKAVKCGKT